MDWLFQANPKLYDLHAAITAGIDRNWSMNQGRKLVSPGDRVYLWVSGPEAHLAAVGRVTSPVYERDSEFGKYAVDVRYDYEVKPPLTRDEIKAMPPPLGDFKLFAGFMGTNARIANAQVLSLLDLALQGRLMALAPEVQVFEIQSSQFDLDKAIKHARIETALALRKQVSEMNPIAFEWLISAVLTKLGYADITVTAPSNDGGVDLRAMLRAGGIAGIKTAVQAKRTQTVGRPVVQNLRGSLTAHELGLLVTSGNFTEGAIEEAKDAAKVPIALVDGRKLMELLLEHQIGATEKAYKAYTLTPESLSLESLKARAEGVAPGAYDSELV